MTSGLSRNRNPNGISMGYQWDINGISMGYPEPGLAELRGAKPCSWMFKSSLRAVLMALMAA